MTQFEAFSKIWTHIPYFLALARSGTLMGASKLVGVNRSTVKRHIDALADALDQPLFHQDSGQFSLLPSGRELLRTAEAAEFQFYDNKGVFDLAPKSGALTGSLRLTFTLPLLHALAHRIRLFCSVYEDLRVEISISDTLNQVDRRDVDIALHVGTEQPSYPLKSQALESVAYATYRSIEYPDPELVEPTTIESLAPNGGAASLTADCVLARRELISAGAGVGTLPTFLGDFDRRLVRISDPVQSDDIVWITTHVSNLYSARVRTFFELFADNWEGFDPTASQV